MASPWSVLVFLLLLLHSVFPQSLRLPNGERWTERRPSSSSGRNVCRQAGSECVFPRDCPSLRAQRNWRQRAEVCGYTSGGRRFRVCCTDQSPPEEVPPVFRSPTEERPWQQERRPRIPPTQEERGPRMPPAQEERGPRIPPVQGERVPRMPPAQEERVPRAPPRANEVEGQSACGLPRMARINTPLVLGGEESPAGMWPWMVAITEKNRQGDDVVSCTAFLIDKRHALSAAHCFTPPDASLYGARIGNLDWRLGQRYTIRSIVVHAGYRQNFFYDDIALLTFAEEVTNPEVTPICLPNERLARRVLDGMGTTVAGWGSTRPGGPMSNSLQHLSAIPVIPNTQCNRILGQRLTSFNRQFPQGISRGFICAGFLEGGKDSCGGDSGGPLMLQDEGRWNVVGIVSFGYDCGRPGYPAGYTRISEYLTWITRQLRS